jgi:hypothetical protein
LESFPEVAGDPSYPKHVIVITQFEAKLNAQKLLTVMKKFQNETTKSGKQVSNKGFHFRLSEQDDALALSGYKYNAITPFFMEGEGNDLPIILSEDIT